MDNLKCSCCVVRIKIAIKFYMASPARVASNSLRLMTLYKQKERPFTKKECCRVESWRKDTLWKPMCLIWGCVCVCLCAHICRYLHWAVLWHIRAECEPQSKTIRRCFYPIILAVYFKSVAKIIYILGYYWKKVNWFLRFHCFFPFGWPKYLVFLLLHSCRINSFPICWFGRDWFNFYYSLKNILLPVPKD